MTPLFNKLNLKDHTEIVVLDAPQSFEAELAGLQGVQIHRDANVQSITFLLAFVQRLEQVQQVATLVSSRANGDAVIWCAYPKGTSKQYTCEFNRDTGWQSLGDAGFEGVRQVAIDADWSALRFRRAEYIKTMTRDAKRRLTGKAAEE